MRTQYYILVHKARDYLDYMLANAEYHMDVL